MGTAEFSYGKPSGKRLSAAIIAIDAARELNGDGGAEFFSGLSCNT
jgi:hypothetical protein